MIYAKNDDLMFSKEELTEIQRFLLEIAEEQIVQKKNLYLYPLDLLKIAKAKIDLSEIELFRNITELYEAKWIIPGKEQLKDHVLDSLKHREIYNYVIQNPGCDTADIMRDLSISFRFALKNLETLFIFGFVRARKYSQYFLYFPFNMSEEGDMLYCVTRSRINRQILKYLVEQKKPVNVIEIANALKIQEITIQRKVTRLVHHQIVSPVDIGLLLKIKINKLDIDRFQEVLSRYKEL